MTEMKRLQEGFAKGCREGEQNLSMESLSEALAGKRLAQRGPCTSCHGHTMLHAALDVTESKLDVNSDIFTR